MILTDLFEALEDQSKFDKLIPTGTALCDVARLFPGHSRMLLQRVLQDKFLFKHIVSSGAVLCDLANAFPEHADVFGKSTLAEALDARKAYINNRLDLRKNSRIPGQADRTMTGFFSQSGNIQVPQEILEIIPRYTVDDNISEKEADETIQNHWSKPC